MNHITELETRIVTKDAEIAALYEGYEAMISYLRSSKFHNGDPLDGYVNVQDVINGLRQSQANAFEARIAAYTNEVGPQIAGGSHRGCTHGTGRVAPVNGWHCPQCGQALPGEWNDTDSKASARMRAHWRTEHRLASRAATDPA
jgi:hypothetical protein